MNLRRAVSLVFVGTLAYACGPQSRSTASKESGAVAQEGLALASIGGSAMRSTNAVEKSVKSTSRTLVTKFDVTLDGSDVRFNLRVVNTTSKSVEVNFASGQAYDFVVVDSVGREVWRWAAGRIFTQSFQAKLLRAGDSMSIAEEWPKAKAGKYKAIAVLHSTNFPVQQEAEFERK